MTEPGPDARLRIAVLGALVVTVGGQEVGLGGRIPRRLLAVLITSEGLRASDADLADRVWGIADRTWRDSTSKIQVNVARINKALSDAGARPRVEREGNGYRLVLHDHELDMFEFERCGDEAEAALRAGQAERAVAFARHALEQWRGQPFDDVDEFEVEQRAAVLEAQRRGIQQTLAEALLELGENLKAARIALELVRAEPENERWRVLLVLALYRSGRGDKALERWREYTDDLRRRGLVLGPDVARLENALLDRDPSLLGDPRRRPSFAGTGGRPDGPKTFLFVDLGRTDRALEPAVLRRYEPEVEWAVTAHRGWAFERGSPRYRAVFEDPVDAVQAACDIALVLSRPASAATRAPRPSVGVHTGKAHTRGSSFGGPHLVHASRLCDMAHPGQVLVSAATSGLVTHELPVGISLREVGSAQVAGSGHPDRVYQLVHDELQADFPPLPTSSPSAGRLPRNVTSFVGRGEEQAEVADALGDSRLVTITGEGGIGKSRLALEVAERAAPAEYFHDARYCDVSMVDDAATLDERVAGALGLAVHAPGSHRLEIVRVLAESQLLLVLDGCEHLREAIGDLVADVLAAGPAGRILATSRARLGVPGEQVVHLETLAVPEPTDPEPGKAYAVQLLVERARAVDAEISPADPAVAELARRLDGLPLAIELAAIRLASFPASTLVERLASAVAAFRGPPGVPDRQRTLRATFEWSFDMLNEAGRRLLAALSVFRGTWTLEAAEAVAPAVGVEVGRVMPLMAELVDLSIVRIHMPAEGTARYRMLDTIRAFAADHLAELGCADAAADLHAEHFLDLAVRAVPHLRGPDEAVWVGEVVAEFDNMRAAYRRFLVGGRHAAALRLVVALRDELHHRERLEIGRWAADLSAMQALAEEPELVDALGLAATAAMLEGRLDEALDRAESALAAERAVAGASPAWMAHNVLAMANLAQRGRGVRWGEHIHAMEDIGDRLGDPFPRALALWNRVFLAVRTNEAGLGERAARKLLALGESHDNPSIRSMGFQARGRAAVLRGDLAMARDWFQQALGAATAANNTLMANTAARELTEVAAELDHRQALVALCRVARSFVESGNVSEQTQTAMRMIGHLMALGRTGPANRALARLPAPVRRAPDYERYVTGFLGRSEQTASEAEHQDGAGIPVREVLAELIQAADNLPDDDTGEDAEQ